jgi:hypothetical protein
MRRFLCSAILGVAVLAGPAMAAPVSLWSSFDVAPAGTYSNVSIALSGSSFRIGDASGPVASDALIAQVLGNLTGVRVGGLGNAVAVGVTTQSFGFFMTNPDLGGAASEDFDPFGDYPFGFSTFGVGTAGLAAGSGGGSPGGNVLVYSFETTPETLIGFEFSNLFLGDKSAAFGQDFTFRWQAGTGAFAIQPEYVRTGGRVILTGNANQVPEPSSIALVVLALASILIARRRVGGVDAAAFLGPSGAR